MDWKKGGDSLAVRGTPSARSVRSKIQPIFQRGKRGISGNIFKKLNSYKRRN